MARAPAQGLHRTTPFRARVPGRVPGSRVRSIRPNTPSTRASEDRTCRLEQGSEAASSARAAAEVVGLAQAVSAVAGSGSVVAVGLAQAVAAAVGLDSEAAAGLARAVAVAADSGSVVAADSGLEAAADSARVAEAAAGSGVEAAAGSVQVAAEVAGLVSEAAAGLASAEATGSRTSSVGAGAFAPRPPLRAPGRTRERRAAPFSCFVTPLKYMYAVISAPEHGAYSQGGARAV